MKFKLKTAPEKHDQARKLYNETREMFTESLKKNIHTLRFCGTLHLFTSNLYKKSLESINEYYNGEYEKVHGNETK